MTRLVLAIVAATVFSGCQHSGQQAIDPFRGRTTVPSPATGSIGAPIVCQGYPQPLQPQPVMTPGTPLPNGGLQPTTQPNLLPAPMSPPPSAPGMPTPMPAPPGTGVSGVPYGYGTPAMTSPPSSYPTPGRAPPSGYSNPNWSPSGSPGSPAAAAPGSAPAATYPSSPASPTAPGSFTPPTGGAMPMGASPGSFSPTGPTPAPTPAGSPPSVPPPGYFPPGGYNYDNRNGSYRPGPGGNWAAPSGVAAAPLGLDGATVSAPPEATAGAGLDAGPSIVRIPTAGDGSSAATPASGEIPAPPAP